MKGPAMKPFLHTVHFLTYGHSKTFTIKEGGCHTQDFVGTVDFTKVYEQVRQLLRQRGLRGAWRIRHPLILKGTPHVLLVTSSSFHPWSQWVAGTWCTLSWGR